MAEILGSLTLPFTPATTTTTSTTFNLSSPHFSPQLSFLLSTPTIRECTLFTFPPKEDLSTHIPILEHAPMHHIIPSKPKTLPGLRVPTTDWSDEGSYDSDVSSMSQSTRAASTSPEQSLQRQDLMKMTMSDAQPKDVKPNTKAQSKSAAKQSSQHQPLKMTLKAPPKPVAKPVRGRQRQLQMTEADRERERALLLEKSRQSARDCRKRKKMNIDHLKQQVAYLQRQHEDDTIKLGVMQQQHEYDQTTATLLLNEIYHLQNYVSEHKKTCVAGP